MCLYTKSFKVCTGKGGNICKFAEFEFICESIYHTIYVYLRVFSCIQRGSKCERSTGNEHMWARTTWRLRFIYKRIDNMIHVYLWKKNIYIYILWLFKTYEPVYAPNTRQNHARGQGTRARDTTDTCASARKCTRNQTARARESSSARAGAQETKPWARKRATQQRHARAHARARHTVSLFARAETLCKLICPFGELMWAYFPAKWAYVCERRSTPLCVRAPCSRASSFLLARHVRASLVARAPRARSLRTCPKMLARPRCAPRSCRGSTYELICFEWSQYIYIYVCVCVYMCKFRYAYIHANREVLSVSVCKGRSICGIANICIDIV